VRISDLNFGYESFRIKFMGSIREIMQSVYGTKRCFSEVRASNCLLIHEALRFCGTVEILCKDARLCWKITKIAVDFTHPWVSIPLSRKARRIFHPCKRRGMGLEQLQRNFLSNFCFSCL
jgi:hypothetical protein